MHTQNEIDNMMQEIEHSLNIILDHIRCSKECEGRNFVDRRRDIELHARKAKQCYDWIDNHTVIRPE